MFCRIPDIMAKDKKKKIRSDHARGPLEPTSGGLQEGGEKSPPASSRRRSGGPALQQV